MARSVGRGHARSTVAGLACLALAACTAGPDYRRPAAAVPATYKEADPAAGTWKRALPADAAARGAWWSAFGDAQLDALEARLEPGNQALAAAAAQYSQALALSDAARSAYYPVASVNPSIARERASANVPGRNALTIGPNSDFLLPLAVSWELDLWGRVRRTVEAAGAGARAAGSDLEAVRLSVRAELALDYFELRALDTQKDLLGRMLAAYARARDLVGERFRHGLASGADVAAQDALLKGTAAQLADLDIGRAQYEHAIAVLQGLPPAAFTLPPQAGLPPVPHIPPGVPSALLERRPDVAAAERRMAAANAQIGIAETAFYPVVSLSALAGFEGSAPNSWLTWPSRLWSIGPTGALTVFDANRRSALSRGARAAYDGTVATYRQAVLGAFQDVEDNLAALRQLEQEAVTQGEAVVAARRSLQLVTERYRAGLSSALDLVGVEAGALAAERVAVDIARRQATATVRLVKALGGTW